MAFIYTRAQLKADLNKGIHGKQGMLLDIDDTINRGVRQVFAENDLRSARRRTSLSPNLYNGIFDYTCPADLAAMKIIDIPAQAARSDGSFNLVPSNEFEISRKVGDIAIDDYNGSRILKINSRVDSDTFVIAELDSLTSGGGTWVLFGDAESVAADQDDYIKGAGSIAFDLSSAGGTTAGIQNTGLSAFDLSRYFGGNSSIFVWARINSATNLTNYILRFGSNNSNYYSKTVTAQADGTAFVSGWNLLRFDISSLSTTGSPDNTDLDYVALYMTKTAGKISESDYKFDYLVVKRGVNHNVKYYSKYGWQSSAGTYKENSTDDSDLLVADTDEYEFIVEKVVELGNREVREYDLAKEHEAQYKEKAKFYQMRNPSEAKIMTSEYHSY